MMRLINISLLGLLMMACGNSESIANSQLLRDMTINRAHNANIIRQVNNDNIILGSKLDRKTEILPTLFRLDGQIITEEAFLSLPLDSVFYAEKRMSYSQGSDHAILKQQNLYKAYSSQYFSQHAFTPAHFDLTIDENDLLRLDFVHPADGDLYAYGFDAKTGKKGIEDYFDLDYSGSYTSANRLLDRNIDELRIVVTLADSLYIHDYGIEDFYTHDH